MTVGAPPALTAVFQGDNLPPLGEEWREGREMTCSVMTERADKCREALVFDSLCFSAQSWGNWVAFWKIL